MPSTWPSWPRRQSAEVAEQVRFVSAAAVVAERRATKERAEWTAYAQRHGLANLCRVLFNSNEFLFVD